MGPREKDRSRSRLGDRVSHKKCLFGEGVGMVRQGIFFRVMEGFCVTSPNDRFKNRR